MELHFVPTLDQVVTMKSDFILYGSSVLDSCSEMNNSVNGILTPTTPSTKAKTADNPFYHSPPFEPFSYSQSPTTTGYCQVSPIEFSPSNKPSSYGNNYCVVNDDGNYYGNYGYSSTIDTPDSVFEDAKDGNQLDYDDNYFKFDPDTVEKFMPHSDILNLDTEYVNFNEDNCNSKNQSPCSSPMDPWIVSSAMIDHPVCVEAKTSNIQQHHHQQQFVHQQTVQLLPSINQAFSNHFTTVDCENVQSATVVYEQNFLDTFDSTFLEDFVINEGSNSNDANEDQTTAALNINPENYDFGDFDEKPNREFKNIWSEEEKLMNAPANHVEKPQNIPITKHVPKQHKAVAQDNDDVDQEHQQLICFWKDCNLEFCSQATLVSHIEKTHVSSSKGGDEYTCLWAECPRQYRSFNARYKLLIHMRVHSGEKPNKCPVSFLGLI